MASWEGSPGHLSLLDPERNIAENAAALLLHSSGRLVDEAQRMLDAFLGEAAVHYSIVEAIASGCHTWKGITSPIGRSGGAALRPLDWLVDMQVVVRSVPVTESSPQRSKRSLYRITDPYVGFWHRFVAPLVAAGSVGLVPPEQLWARAVAPRLDDYMGGVFETACREAVRRGALTLPFAPTRVGEWWYTNSREQIDIVALGGDYRTRPNDARTARRDAGGRAGWQTPDASRAFLEAGGVRRGDTADARARRGPPLRGGGHHVTGWAERISYLAYAARIGGSSFAPRVPPSSHTAQSPASFSGAASTPR